jgi:hypothetical protein
VSPDPWTNAVADAKADPPATGADAIAAELIDLWNDLAVARRDALRGCWSMQCDNIVTRIVVLSRLVGATNWVHIPLTLLDAGCYQGILTTAAIDFEAPDMDVVRGHLADLASH